MNVPPSTPRAPEADSGSEGIFFGTPKREEARFQPVVNILHTVGRPRPKEPAQSDLIHPEHTPVTPNHPSKANSVGLPPLCFKGGVDHENFTPLKIDQQSSAAAIAETKNHAEHRPIQDVTSRQEPIMHTLLLESCTEVGAEGGSSIDSRTQRQANDQVRLHQDSGEAHEDSSDITRPPLQSTSDSSGDSAPQVQDLMSFDVVERSGLAPLVLVPDNDIVDPFSPTIYPRLAAEPQTLQPISIETETSDFETRTVADAREESPACLLVQLEPTQGLKQVFTSKPQIAGPLNNIQRSAQSPRNDRISGDNASPSKVTPGPSSDFLSRGMRSNQFMFSFASTNSDADREAEIRARKRTKRSPERMLGGDNRDRLKSLSPESAVVLSTLFIPSPQRPRTPSPLPSARQLSPFSDVLTDGQATTPSQVSQVRPFMGPETPARRIALPNRLPHFTNPMDDPNRSPARRVLASIASSPVRPRGASAEPLLFTDAAATKAPRRAHSAEPSSSSLPFPLVSAAGGLPPVLEESQMAVRSALKAATKIPRPPTKPYFRPDSMKISAKASITAPKAYPFIAKHTSQFPSKRNNESLVPGHPTQLGSPVKVARPAHSGSPSKHTGPPAKTMARVVVRGMFDKSEIHHPEIKQVKPPHLDDEQPTFTPTIDTQVKDQPEASKQSPQERSTITEGSTLVQYACGTAPLDAEGDVIKDEPPLRRTGRVRKTRLDKDGLAFSDVPRSVRKSTSERTSHGKRNGALPVSGLGMSDSMLRALTGANTIRNQQAIIELDRQLVRREGKRPESPTTKVRTVLEKRKEKSDQERMARRRRRSGEASNFIGGESSDQDVFEEIPTKHRRGPGETEDFETPQRSQPSRRGVKWLHGLYSDPSNHHVPKGQLKGILAVDAKTNLDGFGNLPDAGVPPPGLVKEKVVYTRFVYDDDEDVLTPPPEPIKRTARRKKA